MLYSVTIEIHEGEQDGPHFETQGFSVEAEDGIDLQRKIVKHLQDTDVDQVQFKSDEDKERYRRVVLGTFTEEDIAALEPPERVP